VPFSSCPIATVRVPAERVWGFLSQPENYAQWWDAHIRLITPAGLAHPGQHIEARTTAFGRQWSFDITVERVDHARRVIDLTTRFPFGITVHNHITCVPLDPMTCRVSFG